MKIFVLFKRFLWVVMAAALVVSCASGTPAERDAAAAAVRKYNGRMIRAYMEANIDLMASVATKNQVAKLVPIILALRAKHSLMMADQQEFRINKVSVDKDKAFVETGEKWKYWWQEAGTSKITVPEKGISYKLRYNLVRKDGSWLVDSIESLE